MKKILLMAVAAMMATASAQAQSGYEDTKHEIGVSYGALSNTSWLSIGDGLGSAVVSFGAVRYDDGRFFGPLSVEYFYHLSPVVGLGGIATFARETKDMYFVNDKCGEAKNTFITVMPAAKFNWLRMKHFGLYSKVAAGLTIASKKEDYTKGGNDLSKTEAGFNFQVSALGIEAGAERIRAFIELGVGEQGVTLAGLRVKF